MDLKGKIVFASGKAGHYDIYVLNLDSGRLDQLTMGDTWNDCPKWSPDGRKIVFISNRTGTPEVWLMDEDGSGETRLTKDDRWHNTPDWSPDGQRLVFCANYDGNIDIYTMRIDGTERRRHTNYPEMDYSPQFSPDGKKIVFSSKHSGKPALWFCDIASGDLVQLTDDKSRQYAPAYSPDGKKIAFVSGFIGEEGEENLELCVMDSDGQNQQMLPADLGSDRYAGWSPDGRYLVYTASRHADFADRLMAMEMQTLHSSEIFFNRRAMEEEIGSRPQGLWLFQMLPESLLRKFYPRSYFGSERSPDWKA